jgi:hypothetical protein
MHKSIGWNLEEKYVIAIVSIQNNKAGEIIGNRSKL